MAPCIPGCCLPKGEEAVAEEEETTEGLERAAVDGRETTTIQAAVAAVEETITIMTTEASPTIPISF